jgi:hypothetical protein
MLMLSLHFLSLFLFLSAFFFFVLDIVKRFAIFEACFPTVRFPIPQLPQENMPLFVR